MRKVEARLVAIHPRLGQFAGLVRYYGIAAINTLWGYGVYAGLVALGLNLFAAQIIAHCLGVAFNYFSYSLGVFQRPPQSKLAYLMAYGVNYLVSVSFLALFHALGLTPYLAGLCALVCSSLLNFLVLSRIVFRPPPQGTA
ncbi:GtrA family protein [Sphingomonas sp.]|uniref:GtrA family protein n=1 Tax=Sphingomonas sp. TaxID=28214 RepID=UPI0035BC8DBB